jgi:hypothetical protein
VIAITDSSPSTVATACPLVSDEIHWEVEDRDTGALRARVTMKPGDVAAMPADNRHRGFSPKRWSGWPTVNLIVSHRDTVALVTPIRSTNCPPVSSFDER